jgi:hypothetical protein
VIMLVGEQTDGEHGGFALSTRTGGRPAPSDSS